MCSWLRSAKRRTSPLALPTKTSQTRPPGPAIKTGQTSPPGLRTSGSSVEPDPRAGVNLSETLSLRAWSAGYLLSGSGKTCEQNMASMAATTASSDLPEGWERPRRCPSAGWNASRARKGKWTSALAHCHNRFVGKQDLYHRTRSGGLGAFTPDSFPVFDTMLDNVYVIADSNHGYKMIGVGALAAREILGAREEILEPFRSARCAAGNLHPVSNSPFPWS